jgi:hypothetical protein
MIIVDLFNLPSKTDSVLRIISSANKVLTAKYAGIV